MSRDRLNAQFERLRQVAIEPPPAGPRWPHAGSLLRELFESMLLSRHLDAAQLSLAAHGVGVYTISSAGHETNAVLGRLTRPTDPALLHYRSTALLIERARHVQGVDPVRDVALSLVAANNDPASGGRHKVLGRRELGIMPQTSTIGSHLPRAVGLAFSLVHRRRMGLPLLLPDDSIVLCSCGDASINHSTFLGATNSAGWAVHQHLPLPLLLVCEDNGLGISVRTPTGWVEQRLRALPQFTYFRADGSNLEESFDVAARAVGHCRTTRRPAVLHLTCPRLLGHAGADVDSTYRPPAELRSVADCDPLPGTAELLVRSELVTGEALIALDDAARARVRATVEQVRGAHPLASRDRIQSPVAFPPAAAVTRMSQRTQSFGAPPSAGSTLAQGINAALTELLDAHPEALVFGEDVARKGGVFGVTRGLLDRFGPARVFNTLLDEQSILGLALGAASHGLLPIPEVQYLAFLHNAEDQLRGEAAMLPYLSRGTYDNPVLLRIAGLASPTGAGGPFHNDNSLAVLRDVPGLIVVVPSRADDARELYRAAWELTHGHRRTVVVVEPLALYHERNLYEAGDDGWLAGDPGTVAGAYAARVYDRDAGELTLISYGYGVRRSLRASRMLHERHGIRARVLDLRWLNPLPHEDILVHAEATGRVLVVDECRPEGNVSEGIATLLMESGCRVAFARCTAASCPVPIGRAARLVLPDEDEIVARGLGLAERAS